MTQGLSDNSTVSDWIGDLKQGDRSASLKIWQRYVEQLVREADRRLKNLPRRAVDAEDIVQEAFASFFSGVEAGRFSKLENRHDLWQLLVMLTDRRTTDHFRQHLGPQRGEGHVRGDSAMHSPAGQLDSEIAGFDRLAAPLVTPQSAEELIHLIERSFPALADKELQKIALDRAACYTMREIADRHGLSLRSAERKMELICDILKKAAEEDKPRL